MSSDPTSSSTAATKPKSQPVLSRLSMRSKLVYSFVAIALLPLSILGFYLLVSLFNNTSRNAERAIADKLRIGSLMWEVQKQGLLNMARNTAGDNFIILNRDLGLDKALRGYLEGIITRNDLNIAVILDPAGRLLASTGDLSSQPGLESRLIPYLSSSQINPEVRLIPVPAGSGKDKLAVMALHPIFNYSHNLTGFIATGSYLGNAAVVDEEPFFSHGKAQLAVPYFIMENQEILYASNPELVEDLSITALRKSLPGRQQPATKINIGSLPYLIGTAPLEQSDPKVQLSLLVAYPGAYLENEQLRSLILVSAVIGSSLLAAILLALLLAANISTPMVAIARGARAIVAGNYSIHLPVHSTDEIGQMAEEFNHMTLRLAHTMEELACEVEEHMAAEQYVRDMNNELENRVTERTRELADSLALLQKTQKELVEAEKMAALGNLVGGIAHELNTPIGVILTAVSSMKDQNTRMASLAATDAADKKTLQEYLEYSKEIETIISRNLQRTVERIKFFQQISQGKSEEKIVQLNLHTYVDDFLHSFKIQSGNSACTVLNAVAADVMIEASPGVLYQIFLNLANNSMHHGFEDQSCGTITIASEQHNNELVVNFMDNGKGIEPKVLPKIFEPFYSTKKSGLRAGLGLSVVYNLVSSHLSGTISCQSILGQGTSFRIHIPKRM
jgi:signal transduction histidine kinase